VLDDLSTGRLDNLDGVGVRLVAGSILDDAALDEAMSGAGAVVHLAARPSVPKSIQDPMASHAANATGTMCVLEAMRRHGTGAIVAASSSSVYGANPVLPKSEDLVPMPVSPYAASKLATEAYVLAHAHSFGLRALAFRFFNVYGPLQRADHAYAAVVPAFVSAALGGRPLPVHGDGTQTRDFTYVGAVVAALATAVRDGIAHDRPVNLAFGYRTSLLELIAELGHQLGTELDVEHQPPRAGDVRDSQAETTVLRSLLPGIEPVPLPDGLAATLAWWRGL
jgi:UDP-glucose 4-epimerase